MKKSTEKDNKSNLNHFKFEFLLKNLQKIGGSPISYLAIVSWRKMILGKNWGIKIKSKLKYQSGKIKRPNIEKKFPLQKFTDQILK